MNKTTVAQQAKIASILQPAQDMLQRKCVCGQLVPNSGECGACKWKNKTGQANLPLQAKIATNKLGDEYEREADRVAKQVMAMSKLKSNDLNGYLRATPLVQRQVSTTHQDANEVPSVVYDVLRSPGQPIDQVTRDFMEPRFGYDFSAVRVHTGAKAEKSAQVVNALAYTVGHNMVFGAQQYAPATGIGRRLLAHELTHVVQQSSSTVRSVLQREIEPEPETGGTEPTHYRISPGSEESDDSFPNEIASFDFINGRLKQFKRLERFAPKLKAILDSGPSAVVDIVSVANLRTPGFASDPAEGLLTLLTVWFNLPKRRFRTRRMIIDQPPEGIANTSGYAKAIIVYPGGTDSGTLPMTLPHMRPPIVPGPSRTGLPSESGSEESEPVEATSGLDIDIDISNITNHNIDIGIGTFKVQVPTSVEQAFKPINLTKGTTLHISVKSSLDLEKIFGGMIEDEAEEATATQLTPPEEKSMEIPVQPSFAASIVINGSPQIKISATPNFNLNTGEVGAGVSLSLSGGDCHYVVPAASIDALRAAPGEFKKISAGQAGAEIGVSEAAKLAKNIAAVYDAVKKIEEAKTTCQTPNIEIGASIKKGEQPSAIPGGQPIPERRAEASLKFHFDIPGAAKLKQRGPDFDWELKWYSLPKTDFRLVRSGTLLIAQFAAREPGHIELVRPKGDQKGAGDWLIDSQKIEESIKNGFVEFTAPKADGRYEIRMVDQTGFAYGRLVFFVYSMPKPRPNRNRYDKAGPNAFGTKTA